MSYDRWRMTPETASTLTGVELSAEALERAEEEIRDEIGWTPDVRRYSTDVDDVGLPVDRRVVAMGRAIAWQAALRASAPAAADDGVPAGIGSESVGGGDYAVTYTGGGPVALTVSPRTVELLRGAGWYARTSTGTARI